MPATISGEVKRLARRARDVQRGEGVAALVARAMNKFAVYLIFPWQRLLASRETFEFDGEQLPYLAHPYNATWRSERAVEVPIAAHFLQSRDPARGVEIGNVLSYYFACSHLVVDKYERAPGVHNVDVVDYKPDRPLDWIISLSTLEHVGWDEALREPAKLRAAIVHLRHQLAPGGAMLVTCPRGYNPYLDEAIAQDALTPTHEAFFTRTGASSRRWRQESRADAIEKPVAFDFVRGCASDLWVARFGPL